MQIKKYRATTTREALEQVKRELGEDAFVLEAKRVRTNGFFGFGSVSQIEISAAAAPIAEDALGNLPQTALNAASLKQNRKLDLVDNAPALPNLSVSTRKSDYQQEKLAASLSARAFSDEFEFTGKQPGRLLPSETTSKSGVEIAEHAPRVVHARKEKTNSTNNAAHATNKFIEKTKPAETLAPAAQLTKNDFERLRAELREIKFSLAAFGNHQSASHGSRSNLKADESSKTFLAPFDKIYVDLVQTGIPASIACLLIEEAIAQNGEEKIINNAASCLEQTLPSLIKFGVDPLHTDEPIILAMIGATGVGKTTTIAKLAARLTARGGARRVELITLDTYRIAAVEQLKTYAEIIGANCHIARSAVELQSTLEKLPSESTVLIDTTGRNPHDLVDQIEVSDFLRGRADICKCLVMQAAINPLDAILAIKKFDIYGTNCLALTKLDETMRPGAIIEVAAETALPLVYFGTGQRVPEDLTAATAGTLAARILRNHNLTQLSANA